MRGIPAGGEGTVEHSDPALLVHEPRVSVIVLCYNHERFLEIAVRSVLGQACDFDVEVIIGEDASPDGSLGVAMRLQAQHPDRVRVLTSPTNVGMHANHARLVRAARGRYLAYCEGDDYWTSTAKLAQQVDFLDANPEHVLVHTDFAHVIETNDGQWSALRGFWAVRRPSIPEGDVIDDLLVANFVQTCTMMVRTDTARRFIDSDIPYTRFRVADWPLCIMAAAEGMVHFLPTETAAYRRVAGSATNLGLRADISRTRDAITMTTSLQERFGRPVQVARRSLAVNSRHIAVLALRGGDTATARSAIRSALASGAVPARVRWALRLAGLLLAAPWSGRVLGASLRWRDARRERRHYDSPAPDPAS